MKKFITIILCTFCLVPVFGQTIYSLDDFHQQAIDANKSIQITRERLAVAENLKKAAFTQFFPKITANGSYQWNQKNISLLAADALLPVGTQSSDGSFSFRMDQINNAVTLLPGGVPSILDSDGNAFDPTTNPEKIQFKDYAYLPKSAMEFDTQNIFVGTISVVQPIFMGTKIIQLYNIAKNTQNIAALANDEALQKLIISVDENYWRIVSVYNKKELAKDYCKLLEKLYNNVKIAEDEGVATKVDLLNIRVKLNEAQMSLTRAENGYALCKMALFEICGMDINANVELADNNIEQKLVKIEAPVDPEEVLGKRAEIKTLNMAYNIAEANRKIMASRFMPNIIANANYIVSNPNSYNGYVNEFGGMFNAGITISIPILHWGDELFTYRAAKHQSRIIELRTQQAENLIKLQLSQQHFKLQESNKSLDMTIKNVETAQENLNYAQDAYNEGLITASDLMKAQTAWIKAKSDRIDSSIDLRMCNLYFKRAQGEDIYQPTTEK
ncbi:MAG: TolC family protein [Bacteroidales bacterium]